MKRESNIQAELSYAYESAKGRIAEHKEYADAKRKILEKYDFLKSEDEALEKALTDVKNGSFCQVWVNIEKDEEYYHFADKWIVTEDLILLSAAEYLGFAQVYTNSDLQKIIDKISN